MSDPTAPVARRINRGRGHSYEIDGRKVDGVTTVIGDGIPKPQLVNWAFDISAEYAVDHWDELAKLGPGSRTTRIKSSRYEKRDAAANRGTQIHDIAHRLAAGEEVPVPEELAGHVDAYLKFVDDWEPVELLIEVPVFNATWRYGGTLDLVARLADGNNWLLDFKTGKDIYPEAALQLSAYRNAEFYVDADLNQHPLPPIDFCGCVWLRADGYDLKPVDTGRETFKVFQYAQAIAGMFAREPRDRFVMDALPAPSDKKVTR